MAVDGQPSKVTGLPTTGVSELAFKQHMQPWDSPAGRRRGPTPAGTRRPVGEFTDCLKTGLREDAFAVPHVGRESNLPAGLKPRYLKVSVSTELQNSFSSFNGLRLVAEAHGCRDRTDSFVRPTQILRLHHAYRIK